MGFFFSIKAFWRGYLYTESRNKVKFHQEEEEFL